jgi:hypothetical protein
MTDTKRIRELNIAFWRAPHLHGRLMMSRYISDRSLHFQMKCIEALRVYDGWNADNDSHGEADMCVLDIDGETVWAKVEYHSRADLNYGSDDPADTAKTLRIATLMFPDEY